MTAPSARPLVIGHRGSPAECPENTMASFRRALDRGARMLELDVRLTLDGVPVVIHDELLQRVTGRPGAVGRRTARHVCSLDAGLWFSEEFRGERVPTLEEALRELTERVPINVEMKFRRGDCGPLTRAVARVIRDLGVERRVLVSSFRHEALPLMAAELPGVLVAPLYDPRKGPPGPDELETAARSPLREGVSLPGEVPWPGRLAVIHHTAVREESVRWLRERGGGVIAWTVDEPEDALRLASWGVVGLITNHPARLREVLERL